MNTGGYKIKDTSKMKGRIPWNKGKIGVYKHSEGTKKKISETHKRIGVGKWMKGRKMLEKTKKALIKSNTERIHIGLKGDKNPCWKGGVSKSKEYIKTYNQKYRKENYEKINYINLRRRIRKLGNGGSHTFGEWQNLKAQYNFTCPCCKRTEPEIKLTEDHIIPLSKGGSDNIENIQPLCRSCNSKKHTKIIKF
jgi:5-methylcytosine-specific restriction endonuclease McrA